MENCVPMIIDDQTGFQLQWKDRNDVSQLVGKSDLPSFQNEGRASTRFVVTSTLTSRIVFESLPACHCRCRANCFEADPRKSFQ